MATNRSSASAPDGAAPRRAAGRLPAWTALACGVGLIVAVLAGLGWRSWREGRDRDFLAACQAASARRDWPRLGRLAAEWAADSPGSAAAWLSLAEAAVELGRPAEAAAFLDRIPDRDPRAVPALLARVDLLFLDVGRPLEAVATCDRILKIDPSRFEPHQKLAFFHAVTLQRSRLAEEARRTLAARCDTPETYVYLVGSQWLTLSNTQSMNEGWLRHDPDNELFLVAAACGVPDIVPDIVQDPVQDPVADDGPPAADGADRDPASVEAEAGRMGRLSRLLERFPSNPELLAVFIQRAITKGDVDEVVRLLARAPAAAATDCRFWRFKGWVHAIRGELAESEVALSKALEIDPFDQASQHDRAAVVRKAGRPEAAARWAELADIGRGLRREILQQPDIRSISPALLERVADYAEKCGHKEIADRLRETIRAARSAT
ncbi:MAG: tetratricopeptide repeat protein [Planctomycetia bacterium]